MAAVAGPSSASASPTPLDLSALTDDDTFESESAWLNQLLAASSSSPSSSGSSTDTSLASLDANLAKTLSLLEVATHDTSALVDRTIHDISRSVPRLTFDLQLMRENALLLRFTLDAIRKRAGGTGMGEDSPVAKVMDKLRVLDLVKARMEAARDVLREAESWSTLESEVTALVAEKEYGKAAERLEEAARSMVVFQNTTEYEARRALMVSLQNQLEASLSASLVAAINSRDVKACKTFYSIFGQIQREAEFTAYYFGSRRGALVETWASAVLDDCREEKATATEPSVPPPPSVRFTAFLVKFYGDLHALLNEERTYVPAIFPDPSPTLASFIQTTLEGLSPSLPNRLSSLSEFHGPAVLPELIVAYRATEEFALMVDRIMSKLGFAPSPSPLPPPSTPSKKDRRLSKRMSTSKRLGSRSISLGGSGSGSALMSALGVDATEEEALRVWETAIFEPFLDWQVEYPDLERRYLAALVAKEVGSRDLMEYLVSGEGSERTLWEHTQALFGFAEDAVGRSLALTHGYAAVGLVEVIDNHLVQFLERRKTELLRVRKGGAGKRKAGLLLDEEEAALEGLEYSTEDWTSFQAGLRLLDTCRSVTDKLGAFEHKLRTRLTTLAGTIKDARTDPNYTIPGTTRGAVTMLRQSALNTVELATLLAPLEKNSNADGEKGTTVPLLPRARGATIEFTRATQGFLHDLVLAPLLGHLNEYASLPVWATSDKSAGGKGAFDLSIPTFSLSPTETISRVGEGLFNLPRLFEVYADDDALAFSIETLPFVDAESLRALQYQASTPPATAGTPTTPRSAPHRMTSYTDGEVPPSPSGPGLRRTPSAPVPIPALSAETVIATWLSSLTLSVLSHLTTTVLPSLTRLSKHGAAQLVSDLGYISNVARALDVESPEELEAWREAAELDDKAGKEGEGINFDRGVYERVARLRGWKK
ncbi:component of oligomeric golgi complex 7 [Pseudohyphozyma bogoriensis]|nr:component of oligomeric golgi complex 7 [Pseudohyphozyma bogoriensis]